MEGGCSDSMRGNLILDDGCADHGSDQPPGASGRADAGNLPRVPVQLLLQQAQQFFDGADRIALGPDIFLRQDRVVFIDDDGLCQKSESLV